MKNFNSLTQLLLTILLSNLFADYSVENAFPNLTFEDPVGIYHAGDGSNRIFILEQQGQIKVFDNNLNTTSSETFLDIRSISTSNFPSI